VAARDQTGEGVVLTDKMPGPRGIRGGSVITWQGESGGDHAAISVGKLTAIGLNVSGEEYIFVVAG
jgi:hypothetical protein